MDQEREGGPRTWLVTGCSSGFGREIARAVLAAGDCLVATARRVSDVADLADAGGDRCRVAALDVTDPGQRAAALAVATETWGGLDVLVNNAGVGLLGAVEECDKGEVRRCLEVNLLGPLALTRAALPLLRARPGGGHVVQMGAAAAEGNYPGFGVYGAAKAAVTALSESLRIETAGLGIRVVLVEPGPFRTAFVGRSLQRAARREPAYERTVGKFGSVLRALDGRQPGDPALAAAVLVRLVREGRAPFRLPLGRYMVRKLRERAAELERAASDWEDVAAGTDRPVTP